MAVEIRLTLDFRNKIPISEQVQKEMRRLIQAGFLQSGDQLPTVRVLASQVKVNFNTIARAYRALDHEGLITTQQGRGTYVLELASSENTPLLTSADRADQLVSEMMENAGYQNITLDELYQAFQRRQKKTDQRKQPTRRRIIHRYLKKRVYTPTGDLGWGKTKFGFKLKKHRKTKKPR